MAAAYAGKLADPKFRHDRAVKAAHAAHSLDVYIRRIVDQAPALSPEQKDKLATLLRPTGSGGRAA